MSKKQKPMKPDRELKLLYTTRNHIKLNMEMCEFLGGQQDNYYFECVDHLKQVKNKIKELELICSR